MIYKKKIKIPIYITSFTVFFYDDIDELNKLFYKKDLVVSYEYNGWLATRNDDIYIGFWIKDNNYPTAGTIAHEAKHLVNKIFQDIGQELDLENDEAECYLLGWIVDEIYKLKKQYNERRRKAQGR